MSKKLIIIVIIGVIFLGLIWLITKGPATEKPTEEKPLPEKAFYTREDLKNINPQPGTASIYYMWMAGCPVCAALDKWFEEIREVHSIRVYKFDIARESALFIDVLDAYNVPAEKRGFVPFVFISNEYFIGFNQQIGENMEKRIRECLEFNECTNPYDKLKK